MEHLTKIQRKIVLAAEDRTQGSVPSATAFQMQIKRFPPEQKSIPSRLGTKSPATGTRCGEFWRGSCLNPSTDSDCPSAAASSTVRGAGAVGDRGTRDPAERAAAARHHQPEPPPPPPAPATLRLHRGDGGGSGRDAGAWAAGPRHAFFPGAVNKEPVPSTPPAPPDTSHLGGSLMGTRGSRCPAPLREGHEARGGCRCRATEERKAEERGGLLLRQPQNTHAQKPAPAPLPRLQHLPAAATRPRPLHGALHNHLPPKTAPGPDSSPSPRGTSSPPASGHR